MKIKLIILTLSFLVAFGTISSFASSHGKNYSMDISSSSAKNYIAFAYTINNALYANAGRLIEDSTGDAAMHWAYAETPQVVNSSDTDNIIWSRTKIDNDGKIIILWYNETNTSTGDGSMYCIFGTYSPDHGCIYWYGNEDSPIVYDISNKFGNNYAETYNNGSLNLSIPWVGFYNNDESKGISICFLDNHRTPTPTLYINRSDNFWNINESLKPQEQIELSSPDSIEDKKAGFTLKNVGCMKMLGCYFQNADTLFCKVLYGYEYSTFSYYDSKNLIIDYKITGISKNKPKVTMYNTYETTFNYDERGQYYNQRISNSVWTTQYVNGGPSGSYIEDLAQSMLAAQGSNSLGGAMACVVELYYAITGDNCSAITTYNSFNQGCGVRICGDWSDCGVDHIADSNGTWIVGMHQTSGASWALYWQYARYHWNYDGLATMTNDHADIAMP
jgi:hypothetical protein